MQNNTEEWRVVEAFPLYEVSSYGRIRRIDTQRILKPMRTGQKRKQYSTVRFSTRPRQDRKVHQVVLETFVGPAPPDKPLGLHKDDDTWNNALDNLEWGTHTKNADSCRYRGSHVKLTHGADEVRALQAQGIRGSVIAKQLGISPQLVCDIAKGRRHRAEAK